MTFSCRLIPWFDDLPLQTMRCIMHLVYPETRSWSFILQNGDADADILRHFTWSAAGGRTSMVAIVQPPWILSMRDMERFAEFNEVGFACNDSDGLH